MSLKSILFTVILGTAFAALLVYGLDREAAIEEAQTAAFLSTAR